MAQKLTSHLVCAQQDDGKINLRTGGGKGQTWVHLTKGQASSSETADRTLHRTMHNVQQLREIISGSTGGSSVQQANELRHLQTEEQDQLLRKAGLPPHAMAGYGTGLALKADLHMLWSKLQKPHRWLTAFGTVLNSEAVMRKYQSGATV